MTDFSTTAAGLIADPRFAAALAVALIAGLVRGFSGFGSALIYVPLMAAIYEPRIAALTLLIVDFVASAPFTVPLTRRCNWREVAPVSLAAICTIPLGVAGSGISRPQAPALVHRNPGDRPARGTGVGLALSECANIAGLRRRRPDCRHRRGSSADLRPRGHHLLARRTEHGLGDPREPDGLFRHSRNRVGHRLLRSRPVHG